MSARNLAAAHEADGEIERENRHPADEHGPAGPPASRVPVHTANADLFVKVSDSLLVLFRQGSRIPNEYADREQIPAVPDKSGGMIPKPTPKPRAKPTRRRRK